MAYSNYRYVSVFDPGVMIEYSIERNGNKRRPVVMVNYRLLSQDQNDDMHKNFCNKMSQLLNCVVKEHYRGESLNFLYLIPMNDQDLMAEPIMA